VPFYLHTILIEVDGDLRELSVLMYGARCNPSLGVFLSDVVKFLDASFKSSNVNLVRKSIGSKTVCYQGGFKLRYSLP
jgi:hypothetical protein